MCIPMAHTSDAGHGGSARTGELPGGGPRAFRGLSSLCTLETKRQEVVKTWKRTLETRNAHAISISDDGSMRWEHVLPGYTS